MKQDKQTIVNAFSHAFTGMSYFFLHERNGKLQLFFALSVVALAVGLGVSTIEWMILLLCTGMVLSLEMLNSAVEKLCDTVQEGYHPVIKIIKDVSAAAVLWTAIISAIIGLVIFLPKIILLL